LCDFCFQSWTQCGQWPPSIRVQTELPVLSPLGLPTFPPTDVFCIPGFACTQHDLSLKACICEELEGSSFRSWNGGRHLGVQYQGDEIASAPQSVREIIVKLQVSFGIVASAARLNLYMSGDDYKTLHRDRVVDRNGLPQYTVGLSLGAAREMALLHEHTGFTMTVPFDERLSLIILIEDHRSSPILQSEAAVGPDIISESCQSQPCTTSTRIATSLHP